MSVFLPPWMRRHWKVFFALAVVVTAAAAALIVVRGSGKVERVVRPGDVPQCGVAWRVMEVAKPSPIYNELHGVAVLADDDVWAVGTLGEEFAALTLVEHWDGKEWTHVESPSVDGFSNHLYGISAVSARDIWAVGAHHNGTDVWRTTAMHWDGAKWQIVPTPSVGQISSLNGVAAIAGDDVWAVGESSTGNKGQGTQSLLMHWNGREWSLVNSGEVRTNATLSAVAAVGKGDVWAAGSYTDRSGTVYRPLFMHFDGREWSEVEAEGDASMWSISAVSAADVWATGNFGPQPVAMHWDGSKWARVPTPNVGTGNNTLNGVVALGANDVWAVGSGYVDGADVAMAMHFDGSTWKLTPAVTVGKYSDVLWAAGGVKGGDVWAVGAYIGDELGNNAPVVERWGEDCRR